LGRRRHTRNPRPLGREFRLRRGVSARRATRFRPGRDRPRDLCLPHRCDRLAERARERARIVDGRNVLGPPRSAGPTSYHVVDPRRPSLYQKFGFSTKMPASTYMEIRPGPDRRT
jgi:hypothetical protein